LIKRAAALLVVLAAGACSSTPTPEAGQLRVTPLGGTVSLLRGGETTLLEEATTIDAGVSVVTAPGGRAQVELPGERSIELAPATELRIDDQFSEVSQGSVLVRASSPLTLRAGGSDIEADDAIFRVDRSALTSVLLATYSGEATVVGSGVPAISALRQADVLPGGETLDVEALDVRRNDPWDAELLGQAIDLGLRLFEYERGLTRQLPSNRETDAVSGVLERGFSPRAIRSAVTDLGNAAKAVVAAVVAQEASRLEGLSAPRVLAQIVNLIRDLGANWVIVVAEWGLPAAAAALTDRLGQLADLITDLVAPAAAPSLLPTSLGNGGTRQIGPPTDQGGEGPVTGRDGDPTTPPGDTGSGGNGDITQPPDAPPPDEQPAQNAQPPPPPPCANTVECTVEDIPVPPGTGGEDTPRGDSPLPI
jgi:hypothetical protein